MIESDQSDKDNLNDSLDSNERTKKRIREDSSDDGNAHSSPKKLCTSDNKITLEETKLECKSEINGSITNIREATSAAEGGIKDADISNNTEDPKDTNISSSEEDVRCTDAMEETLCNIKSENENKELSTINNGKETESEKSTDNECKDSIPVDSQTKANAKEAIAKNQDAEEDEKNSKPRKKRDKSQIEDTEVVEGLELSVECASDKESSSSSESENEKDKKPKSKTIIVKAEPNDSELDVSTSEAEKSDLQDASEVKPKQSTKKGKRKARTSFSKPTDGDSEENDDVSDEDYSPRTKRKLKKTQTTKRKSSSSELKGSHDRAKQIDEKLVKEEEEEEKEEKEGEEKEKEEEEEENSDTMDDKKTEEISKKKKMKPSDKKIEMLKKYIRIAGVRVKSYATIWAGCKSNAAKIRCLEELLEKNGVSGRPTLEKCKKAKDRNERLKDIAELNTSNIISEGRVTRAQRKREIPTEHRQARSAVKRVLRIVDSDSE